MKLDIFNINEFIKINNIKQITNPIALNSTKMPTSEGIFSYDIFGYTTEERKNNFGYISLNGHFFHPQCLKAFKRMGSLIKIANRDKYAVVVDGRIHVVKEGESFPDAQTGSDFFYDHWDEIHTRMSSTGKIEEDDELSVDKKSRIDFFKYLKKDEAFVDSWLVLPPFYRDINSEDATLGDDINKIYNELISRANSLKTGFGYSAFGDVAKDRIQCLLGMLYDISLGPVTGKTVDIKTNTLVGNSKKSLIKRNLLGRYLDFSASSVITSPLASTSETVESFPKFGEVTLPLQTFMAMAKPFFVNYCQNFLENYANVVKGASGKEIKKFDVVQWSVLEIDKAVSRFIKTASDKDRPLLLEYINNDNEKKFITLNIEESETEDFSNSFYRPMTYLDLYYIAACDICKDKYSLNTRYPVTNNQNIYPAKIKVNSTNKTRSLYVRLFDATDLDKATFIHYNNYPYVSLKKLKDYGFSAVEKDPKPDTYYELFRATIIGNGHIKSLGADYDGDMLFFRCLFTKEANQEAERLIWKKTNWFLADGSLSRGINNIGKDCSLSLYQLTKD